MEKIDWDKILQDDIETEESFWAEGWDEEELRRYSHNGHGGKWITKHNPDLDYNGNINDWD